MHLGGNLTQGRSLHPICDYASRSFVSSLGRCFSTSSLNGSDSGKTEREAARSRRCESPRRTLSIPRSILRETRTARGSVHPSIPPFLPHSAYSNPRQRPV